MICGMSRRSFRWTVCHSLRMKSKDFATLSFFCDKNGKKYRGGGFGGVNPFCNAASMIGNTSICALTAKQISFRKDVTIWLEASTTSASCLITDDKRFYQTFESCYMMDIFKVCCERSLQKKPVTLVSAIFFNYYRK